LIVPRTMADSAACGSRTGSLITQWQTASEALAQHEHHADDFLLTVISQQHRLQREFRQGQQRELDDLRHRIARSIEHGPLVPPIVQPIPVPPPPQPPPPWRINTLNHLPLPPPPLPPPPPLGSSVGPSGPPPGQPVPVHHRSTCTGAPVHNATGSDSSRGKKRTPPPWATIDESPLPTPRPRVRVVRPSSSPLRAPFKSRPTSAPPFIRPHPPDYPPPGFHASIAPTLAVPSTSWSYGMRDREAALATGQTVAALRRVRTNTTGANAQKRKDYVADRKMRKFQADLEVAFGSAELEVAFEVGTDSNAAAAVDLESTYFPAGEPEASSSSVGCLGEDASDINPCVSDPYLVGSGSDIA
jgi:hypothetical protein